MRQNRLLQEQRDLQESLNRQLQEATQAKLIFYTSVSHDLRTPLTLISEPVDQLAQASNLTPQQHTLMLLARKNVKILHRLINQILDFRKSEFVCILGQSGCGKTTLLNIIGGLDRYTDGDLIINVARPSILKHPTGTRTATKK